MLQPARDPRGDGARERAPQPRALEQAIELHLSGSAGPRSRLEKRFRRLIAGAGLPRRVTT